MPLPFVATVSPRLFATGIAIAPREPVPPEMNTVWPGFAFISSKACMAVRAVSGTVAASSRDRYSGTWARAPASTAAYSANAPIFASGMRPYTRSPTSKARTLAPTSSTTPENSLPMTRGRV